MMNVFKRTCRVGGEATNLDPFVARETAHEARESMDGRDADRSVGGAGRLSRHGPELFGRVFRGWLLVRRSFVRRLLGAWLLVHGTANGVLLWRALARIHDAAVECVALCWRFIQQYVLDAASFSRPAARPRRIPRLWQPLVIRVSSSRHARQRPQLKAENEERMR
jgi:hypothetical protein